MMATPSSLQRQLLWCFLVDLRSSRLCIYQADKTSLHDTTGCCAEMHVWTSCTKEVASYQRSAVQAGQPSRQLEPSARPKNVGLTVARVHVDTGSIAVIAVVAGHHSGLSVASRCIAGANVDCRGRLPWCLSGKPMRKVTTREVAHVEKLSGSQRVARCVHSSPQPVCCLLCVRSSTAFVDARTNRPHARVELSVIMHKRH